MAIPNQAQFLAHAGNADVKAYVDGGGNFNDWWNNYGVNENRQWQVSTPTITGQTVSGGPTQLSGQIVSDNPYSNTATAPQNYASRYHEIRGIDTDFGALGMNVPDYSTTAVSTAAHKNPYHYVNSQTGELNKDQLRQEIQSGAFRFNPDYYAAQNPDLAAAGITSGTDLMNHFLDYGWNEGRNYAINNPNYTSDISNGFGSNVSGVNGSALPQFQDTLGGWNNTGGTGQQNAYNYDDFMSQFQDMFGDVQNSWQSQFSDMQNSWQNQFSDLQSQWQNQQNEYQQYTDQFFNNLWSTQPQAATYMSGNWNDPYQQHAILPPQYQANNGGPQNGFAPNWQQSNPFSIPTF